MAAAHDKIMMIFGLRSTSPLFSTPQCPRQQDAIAIVRARSYFSAERRTLLFCVSQT